MYMITYYTAEVKRCSCDEVYTKRIIGKENIADKRSSLLKCLVVKPSAEHSRIERMLLAGV